MHTPAVAAEPNPRSRLVAAAGKTPEAAAEAQICNPPPRIVSMRAAGVTTQIRPVSWRRIDAPTAPPRYGFAAGCNNCLHPSCHRVVRISTQEILIVLQIVAIQSCEIAIPRVKITDGLRSDR